MQENSNQVDPEKFRRALIECVDSGLQSFGSGVDNIVSFYLENKKDGGGPLGSPQKTDEFDRGLESFFGTVAAKIVEEAIVQQIKMKFGVSNGKTIVEAIKEAREKSEISMP